MKKTVGLTTPKETITVEALRCRDCGRLVISLDDHRITKHKCSGAWNVEFSEHVEPEEIRKAIRGAFKQRTKPPLDRY